MALQIKSRKRVTSHGEVFTNEREVKAMCDLVEGNCEWQYAKVLEPACGDGNFLAEILRRKLARVKQLHKNNPYDYERYSILALTTIYGVDILKDNTEECRARLFNIWEKEYRSICKKACNEGSIEAAKYILSQNILCGNALTMMQVGEDQEDMDLPIIFPEWSLIKGKQLRRRDFRLDVLLKANTKPHENGQACLDEELAKFLSINPVTGEYMPEPIKIYPPIHYEKIMEVN